MNVIVKDIVNIYHSTNMNMNHSLVYDFSFSLRSNGIKTSNVKILIIMFFFSGWLCDITGTYDLSFYLAGLFIAVSGLLLVILPATKRYKRFQTLQRQNSKSAFNCHVILASCITGRVADTKLSSPEHANRV